MKLSLIFTVLMFLFSSFLLAQWTGTNFSTSSPITITDVAVVENYFFVSTSHGSIYRSSDNGNNWNEVNNGISANYISKLYYETNGSSVTFYAATDSGLFISANFGDNWNTLNNGITDKFMISIYKTGNYLFAGSNDSKEYRSSDKN